jgi:hypothetical protein
MMSRSYTRVNRYDTKEEAEEGPDVDLTGEDTIIVDVGNGEISEADFDPNDGDEEFNILMDGDKDANDENME